MPASPKSMPMRMMTMYSESESKKGGKKMAKKMGTYKKAKKSVAKKKK